MANKKFSEFVLKTSTSDVSHIVGYNGAENVQITPANFVTSGGTGVFLPLAGGTMTGNTIHNDNVKSIYGNPGNDLEIYHDGSNSYIKDVGSGGLRIASDLFRVYNADLSELMINAVPNDRVELYFNDSKKFETTSTGISVTGNGVFTGGLTAIGLNIDASTYHKVIASFPSTYVTNLQIGQQLNLNNDALTDTVTFAHAGTEAASDFIFTVGNNEKLRLQGNGSLGLGVSTFGNFPTAIELLVKGSAANTNSIVQAVSNDNNSSLAMYSGASASDNPSFVFQNDLRFGSATNAGLGGYSEKMRLDASGNLGLGIVPQQLLHINNTSGSFGAEAVLRGSTSTGTPKSEIAFKRAPSADGAEMILRTSNSSGTIQDVITLDTLQNATFAGNIILNNNTGELQSKDAGGVAARILTMDNADTLILGNITTVDDIRFDVDTYGEAAMRITSAGHIVAPAGYIEYGATGSGYLRLKSLNPSTTAMGVRLVSVLGATIGRIYSEGDATTSLVSLQSGDGLTSVNVNQNTHIDFRIANSEKMRISSGGDVSIGNTATGAALTVFEDDTSTWNERQFGNSNTTGAAQKMTVIRQLPSNGVGTILEIPFTSQGNANRTTIIKLWGHSAIFNSSVPKAFEATITVGHLTTLSNLSVLSSSGNIASVTVSGMSILVTFTQGYHNATIDRSGLFLNLEYMTPTTDKSIIISGLALN